MHKRYKVIIPRATLDTSGQRGPRRRQKSRLRGGWGRKLPPRISRWTRLFRENPPPPPTVLPFHSIFLLEQKFPFFRGWERHCKVLSQTNGHTTADIMALGYPADSLSVVSLPSCPICYCLISSAKEPLPCQLSAPSVRHKMAVAQEPNTALLPGTRLPSLPQSANTGSHCWQSQAFITTTLTSAGLFVISLLSWFWLYNHLPLIQFASVLLLTDFTLHINLPLACYCICSLFYY